MLIVQKFGGSSLAGPERLRRSAGIILEAHRRGNRVLAVVSAAGDSTDELIDLARQLEDRPPLREMDALLSTGEQQSAALMAIMLHALGASARSFTGWQAGIHTDGAHGEARIRQIDPRRLLKALDRGEIAVTAGFQGLSEEGEICTLGRGGSDTTAVALAAAVNADRCEIYTDVDGVYTADPRLVPGARLLPEMDLRDMLVLAEGGSQVLHPESVRRAIDGDVDLRLLSSFRAVPGTALALLEPEKRPLWAGVTRNRELSRVTLAGRGADETAAQSLRQHLLQEGLAVSRTECSPGRVCFTVPPAQLEEATAALHRILFE